MSGLFFCMQTGSLFEEASFLILIVASFSSSSLNTIQQSTVYTASYIQSDSAQLSILILVTCYSRTLLIRILLLYG